MDWSFHIRTRNSYIRLSGTCIVLHLYIYIALLAAHTNQKRFQCERPREKRADLRERKEIYGTTGIEI